MFLLVLSVFSSLVLAESVGDGRIISVVRDKGNWSVEKGVSDDFLVVANLTETRNESGWDHLDIRSRVTLGDVSSDEDVAVAAGIAEGYLTHNLIMSYYKEFIHTKICTKVRFVSNQYNKRLSPFVHV